MKLFISYYIKESEYPEEPGRSYPLDTTLHFFADKLTEEIILAIKIKLREQHNLYLNENKDKWIILNNIVKLDEE